jgi:hypothetical protein
MGNIGSKPPNPISITNSSNRSRTISEPPNSVTIPICEKFSDEGSIQIKYTQEYTNYKGIFSFVIYFRENDEETFKSSIYFTGLSIYAEIIHSPLFPFFKDVGMILYTDKASYNIVFPFFAHYKKLMFGIVVWPKFTIKNTIEDTILRCMRYQALEAFPNAWICIRDADTLFPDEIIISKKYSKEGLISKDSYGRVIDYMLFFIEAIGKWEEVFIITWLEDVKNPIYLGVFPTYKRGWHSNMAIKWPIKKQKTRDFRYKTGFSPNEGVNNRRRFAEYEYTTKNKLVFTPPLGVLAGFTNFNKLSIDSPSRPNDVWCLCYDYLISRYFLIYDKDDKDDKKLIVNNKYVKFSRDHMSTGKDERMILFAIIPKYVTLCYFFWINYSRINNNNNNNESLTPSSAELSTQSFNAIDIKKNLLLTFGDDKRVETIMLQPSYVSFAHRSLRLNKRLINQLGFNFNFKKSIHNSALETLPANDIFKIVFIHFADKYNKWLSAIFKNTNFQNKIQAVMKGDGYDDKLTNIWFYEPPSRINPSRLTGGRTRKTKYNKRRYTKKLR